MITYTKKPVFFEQNRVRRVYTGGYLFGAFMGGESEDTNYPEEWVASSVCAINDNSTDPGEGLSVIEGTDITLKELLERYPKETLGNRKSLEILVKYLDSAIRLPLQAHPDKKFSETYFSSSYGKTEMWLILATREDASICFGFKDKITKEEFSAIIEESRNNKNVMDEYLHKVAVKPGDIYLIPAKAVHAIGKGCLILEVQEPTDFTIQPEYWCGDYLLNEQEMYMRLPKDIALDCFDYDIYGEECIHISKKSPKLVEQTAGYRKEALITSEDTPCFSVDRYHITSAVVMKDAPAIYIIVNGSGMIYGESYGKEVQKGAYFFLPQNAEGKFEIQAKEGGELELVVCIPPIG